MARSADTALTQFPRPAGRLQDLLRTELARRIDAGFTPRVSRRAFMIGSGSIGLLALPIIKSADPLVADWRNGALSLSLGGGKEWVLDPAMFAAGARVTMWESGNRTTVRLADARLPGTTLRLDLVAVLTMKDGVYRIAVSVPGQGLRASGRFEEWLSGNLKAKGRGQADVRVGRHFSARARDCRKTLDVDWACSFLTDDGTIHVSAGPSFDARSVSFAPGPIGPVEAEAMGALPGASGSFVTIDAPSLPSQRCGARGHMATLQPLPGASLRIGSVEAGNGHAGRPASCLLFDGPIQIGLGSRATKVRFDRALAVVKRNGRQHAISFAGILADDITIPFGQGAGVLGPSEEFVGSEFRTGETPSLSAQARLKQVSLSLPDGVMATIDLPGIPTAFQFTAPLTPERPPGDNQAPLQPANQFVLAGEEALADIDLGGARIQLRRGTDLFSLDFSLTNYRFALKSRLPRLLRANNDEAAFLTVFFPPQHLAEEWDSQRPSGQAPTNCPSPDRPTRSRLSAPSQVVFALDRYEGSTAARRAVWGNRDLTIESLTKWSRLDMVVDPRAKSDVGVDPMAQLHVVGIDKDTTLVGAMDNILGSLGPPRVSTLDRSRGAPGATALELHSRLIFSPSDKARWITPQVRPRRGSPLWRARLDPAVPASMRALWSRSMTKGEFPASPAPSPPPPAPTPLPPICGSEETLYSLSADAHWQIVGQTSTYGLPVRRRISDDNGAATPSNRVAHGGVYAPVDRYTYLQQVKTSQDAGIAIATPFEQAELAMTALGASFQALWRGDPPRILPPAGGLLSLVRPQPSQYPYGFSLEKLAIQTYLGRDIKIEAVTKGYLYPIGVPASFVQLVERKYVYSVGRQSPVATLFKRVFIVIQKPEKVLPALNQPFDGRQFATGTLRMITVQTPDLVNPEDMNEANGRLRAALGYAANCPLLAFWPLLPGTEGANFADAVVRFKFALDDDATPAVAPFMFVDNLVAGDPAAMRKLADYYRNKDNVLVKAPLALRTAAMGGARRRYAVSRSEGDTSFDTESWEMGVTGRVLGPVTGDLADPANHNFDIDGRMEGANQPPFYPTIHRARIAIQSADQLLGRPLGQFTVAHSRNYVENGFNEPNQGEVYLEVRSPLVTLELKRNGGQAGGIARPTSYLAGLSRKSGLVGAQERAASSLRRAADANTKSAVGFVAPASGELSFDFGDAEANRFNPSGFFKGAKLLGILPLADVIMGATDMSSAPKLLQTFVFGPGGAGEDTLAGLQDAARRLQAPVAEAFAAFETKINEAIGETYPGKSLESFYPEFAKSFRATRDAVNTALTDIPQATNLLTITQLASPAVLAAKALIPEFERIAKDPVPPQAADLLNLVLDAYEFIRRGIPDGPKLLFSALDQAISDNTAGFAAFLNALGQPLVNALLGAPGVTFAELYRDPGALVERALQTLFGQQFAQPLAKILTILSDLRAGVQGQIALSRVRVEREISDGIAGAWAEIEEELGFGATLIVAQVDSWVIEVGAIVEDLATSNNAASARAAVDALNRAIPEQRAAADGVLARLAAVVPTLDDARLREAAVRLLTQRVAAQLDAVLWGRIDREIDRAKRLIAEYETVTEEAGLRFMATLLATAFGQFARLASFAQVARAAEQLSGWCQNFQAIAKSLASECLGPTVGLAGNLDQIVQIVAALDPQPSQTHAQLRKEALETAQAAARVLARFHQARVALDQMATSDQCTNSAALLEKVSALVELRRQVAAAIAGLAEVLARLSQLFPDIQASALQDIRALVLHGTAIGAAALAGTATSLWGRLSAEIRAMAGAIVPASPPAPAPPPEVVRFVADLLAVLNRLERDAVTISQALNAAPDLAGIAVPAKAALDHVIQNETALIAEALRTRALNSAMIASGQSFATRAMGAVVPAVSGLHGQLLKKISDLLNSGLIVLLIPVDTIAKLRSELARVQAEDALLARVALPASDLASALELASLWSRNGRPAVVDLAEQITQTARALVQGNLAAMAIRRFQQELRVLERRLREVISQFIPVGVNLEYTFASRLQPFPSGQPVFMMTDKPHPQDLTIRSEIAINFLDGRRETRVTGTIRPFTIKVLGSIPIVDIHFGKATFTLTPGRAPKFDVAIRSVQLNKNLDFIKPLQAWLSPASGPYFELISGKNIGVEVGYRFDFGLISIGNVQFIDVTFGIAARLFLDGAEAEFAFNVGTAAKPFAIACAPYGGVGYVRLVANAQGFRSLELSLQMGAVTAIRFGPLRGYGRVTTGFGIAVSGQDRRIFAIVEAMGEGSVAFFSIAISLRVLLVQEVVDGHSSMYGTARYSYRFKLGFVRYRYSVTARYLVKGKKSARTDESTKSAGFGPGPANADRIDVFASRGANGSTSRFPVENRVPLKSRKWDEYQGCLDHDLLETLSA